MSEDTRSWSQVIEDDLYEQDKVRFEQWVAEHPHPVTALKTKVEILEQDLKRMIEHYSNAEENVFSWAVVDDLRDLLDRAKKAEDKT